LGGGILKAYNHESLTTWNNEEFTGPPARQAKKSLWSVMLTFSVLEETKAWSWQLLAGDFPLPLGVSFVTFEDVSHKN
jgi:hypothetical protein